MSDVQKALLQALVELEETVAALKTANPKPNLLPYLERVDELTRELPRGTDPALLHYLHKKSYEKARRWLEGREDENRAGNCRHVE